ncbi:MAG: TRAP transporter substrate-binding protein DctP, partial [Chloroflexi bacterium]|nr:TRAP transporter substrate-binding protein DctP [Chloroflexota bacterium]
MQGMRQKHFKVLYLVLGALMVLSLVAACTSAAPAPVGDKAAEKPADKAAPAKAVTLKSATAWPKNTMENEGLWRLEDVLKKSGSGISFNYVGGPEAIPTFELIEAVRKGLVDFALTANAYNSTAIPPVLASKLSPYSPWEEREKKVDVLWNQIFEEKGNAHYIGRGMVGKKFRLYTNKEVKSSADFKGLRIRVTPVYKAFVESLGAQPITTDPGEVYTALERNVVDGYGWPVAKISDFGWQEVTKYAVNPPFYEVDVVAIMNLDSWKKLSQSQQGEIIEGWKKVERDLEPWIKSEIDNETKFIQEKGVKIITVSDAGKY